MEKSHNNLQQEVTPSRLENEDRDLNLKMQGTQLNNAALEGTILEHDLSILECVKAYPTAIFWALMVSMCVIMEGYDTILIGNFYAYPQFAKKYGTFFPGVGYQLTAPWQAGLGNASGIGAFFGALLNGYLVAKFGVKRVIVGALIFLSATLFIVFFAPNIEVLLVGQLICGLPWGVFATIAPAYASEVLPLSLRVYLTSYTNMCFIIGQLIAAGVLAGLVDNNTEWAFKIPFAIQWVWPAFLIPLLCFAPESPWHLVRVGRLEDAERSLKRLVRKSAGIDTKTLLASIVHTNELEQELETGTTYKDCFKGPELRRTEIACVAFAGQILSGSTFAYNSTYFFQQVGLNTDTTYKLNVGGTGMALFGTLVSWFLLMPYFGRRTIYLTGMFAMACTLYVIGILNTKTSISGVGMSQAVLTLVWTFMFQLSVGQLGWALPAEMGSTRLRQKTIVLARNSYYVISVISNVLQPYFMNPTEWNLRGYTGFIWGSTAFMVFVWGYFRLPETRGRTFEELDILFAEKVPAKKFKSHQLDAFQGRDVEEVARKLSVAHVE
ncbi:general substrate transporter [Cadophora sp. MPI-SDFR-AT-0126]|nr:general substrate transporter [Leotiomycetes sp. MPI-SDFR-AT-0126]